MTLSIKIFTWISLFFVSVISGACTHAPDTEIALRQITDAEILSEEQGPFTLFVARGENKGKPALSFGSVMQGSKKFSPKKHAEYQEFSWSVGKASLVYQMANGTDGFDPPDFSGSLDVFIRPVFGEDAKDLNLSLIIAPDNANIDHLFYDELNETTISPEFVVPEKLLSAPWQATMIGLVAHEVHHAYIKSDQSDQQKEVSFLSPEVEIVYTETAAHLFAQCVNLHATGRASAFGEKIIHEDKTYDIASDRMLLAIDDGRLKGETRLQQFFLGRVVADAIWDRKIGNQKEVLQGSVEADRLNDLCTVETIGSVSALRKLVLAMVDDGASGE